MTSEDTAKNPAMNDPVAAASAEATGASSATVAKNDTTASNVTETKKREAEASTNSDEGDDTTVQAKRPKTIATKSSDNNNPNKENTSNEQEEEEGPLDLANVFGYKVGERFEVQWDIVHDEGTDDAKTVTLWWGATLMEYDGKTEDSVAV